MARMNAGGRSRQATRAKCKALPDSGRPLLSSWLSQSWDSKKISESSKQEGFGSKNLQGREERLENTAVTITGSEWQLVTKHKEMETRETISTHEHKFLM